jgi:hypothetical protein
VSFGAFAHMSVRRACVIQRIRGSLLRHSNSRGRCGFPSQRGDIGPYEEERWRRRAQVARKILRAYAEALVARGGGRCGPRGRLAARAYEGYGPVPRLGRTGLETLGGTALVGADADTRSMAANCSSPNGSHATSAMSIRRWSSRWPHAGASGHPCHRHNILSIPTLTVAKKGIRCITHTHWTLICAKAPKLTVQALPREEPGG